MKQSFNTYEIMRNTSWRYKAREYKNLYLFDHIGKKCYHSIPSSSWRNRTGKLQTKHKSEHPHAYHKSKNNYEMNDVLGTKLGVKMKMSKPRDVFGGEVILHADLDNGIRNLFVELPEDLRQGPADPFRRDGVVLVILRRRRG